MSAYGDKVIKIMKEEGPDKAISSVLSSVQDYADKVLKILDDAPASDSVCFLAAIKLLDRSLKDVFPKEYSLSESLTGLISINTTIFEIKADGSEPHITCIKDTPKR